MNAPSFCALQNCVNFLMYLYISRPLFLHFYGCRHVSSVANCYQQCCGSVTFWYGSGSGSADPRRWLPDLDPSFFVSSQQDACKKLVFFKVFLLITFWRYISISFLKYKIKKKSQNSRNQVFPTFFLLDSGRIRMARTIRIHNTGLQEYSAGRLKSSAAREKFRPQKKSSKKLTKT